jgi:hypothetical protein
MLISGLATARYRVLGHYRRHVLSGVIATFLLLNGAYLRHSFSPEGKQLQLML